MGLDVLIEFRLSRRYPRFCIENGVFHSSEADWASEMEGGNWGYCPRLFAEKLFPRNVMERECTECEYAKIQMKSLNIGSGDNLI